MSDANVSLEQQAAALRRTNERLQSEIVGRRRVEDELRQSLDRAERARQALLSASEDQKRVATALRESEMKYRLLAEASHDMIILVNRRFEVEYTNTFAAQQFGVAPQEVIGKRVADFFPPEVVRRQQTHLQQVLDSGQSLHVEAPVVISGSTVWLSSWLVPIKSETEQANAILIVSRDVTERIQAEAALQQSERMLRNAEAKAHLGCYQIDVRTGKVVWSEETFRIFGLDPSSPAPTVKSYRVLVHPDDASMVFQHFDESIKARTPFDLTYRIVRSSGEIRYVHSIGTVEAGPGGTAVTMFGTLQDITEREQAEEALRAERDRFTKAVEEREKLQARLNQAQKMESIGRLAGGVAHDFNNMLAVILGHVEMAIDQVDPGLPLHADLQEIRKAASRSADLTSQLLAFARKQTAAPKVLDLNEVVTGTLKMLERLIGEDIHLRWQPKADLWPVQVDPSQVDQILANLCINARDAIAGVGEVIIETGNAAFDEAFCAEHPGFAPGGYVLLAVSDDGCGMGKETLNSLFEPFFTTKEMGKGTGLGLATVYGIVQQNNGFINVSSEPGKGTTFKIYLPRHAAKPERTGKEGPAASSARGHETILLVEDEPAVLRMTATMLERQGYTVLAAGTPGEAIRLARERAGEIDLLMTDVVMPEMNGRDLARNLLSRYPHLKRLFTSGYTANVIANEGVLNEGMHFIQKPFSGKDLTAKVREVLESE